MDNEVPVIIISLGKDRVDPIVADIQQVKLFTPGEVVTSERGVLRGHGTYEENEEIKSSVAGVCERVSKLIIVNPVRTRFRGEIGDVVVGRIVEVQQKRWKVDINARLDAVLLLSSVNLPGGELRRRSVEDERMMRKYLSEGDLISAEVQNSFSDGSLSLHTRSLKYGKLSQGILVKVHPGLIKRCKSHFYTICGASVILGTNGYIWLYPTPTSPEDGAGGFAKNLELNIKKEEREVIIRMRSCIQALVSSKMQVFDTSIIAAFDASQKYNLSELNHEDILLDIALDTRLRLNCPEGIIISDSY